MGRTVAMIALGAVIGIMLASVLWAIALQAEREHLVSIYGQWQKERASYDAVCYWNVADQSKEWRERCVIAAGHVKPDGTPWFCFSRESFVMMGSVVGASCVGP